MDNKEMGMIAALVVCVLAFVFVAIQLNSIREAAEMDAYYSHQNQDR